MHLTRLTLTALLMLSCVPAGAWDPNAPPPGMVSPPPHWGGLRSPPPGWPPTGHVGPGWNHPGGQVPGAPMRSPWLIPPAPETPPEWVAPGFGNPAPNTFYGDPSRGHRALSIARRVQPDAYLVEIRLRNIDPGVVRIEPWGHALRIGYQLQAQAGRGNGYPNAFSSSSASQTLRFPADAHLASMSREITADRINLRIPRIN